MRTRLLCLGLLLLLLGLAPALGASAQSGGTPVFFNELHYDNDGTDAGEALEIAGPAGTDLAGWSIVLYNGNGGAVYTTTTLSGAIPDLGDGYGVVVVNYPVNGIQNGSPDGMALVGPGDVVVQFLSYEGTFTAVGGPADGMTSIDIGVDEPYTTPLDYSLQLGGAGVVYEDFVWNAAGPNTLGAINTNQTFGGGGQDITSIYEIQTTADPSGDSPYKDQVVTTEGVVTASFYNGFFIQDPAGGPWSGLYVYSTGEPAVGDRLRLTGTVAEYSNLTELTSLTELVVLSSGYPVPEPAVLPTGSVSQEQWEGVLVRVENVTVTGLLSYGEWTVDDSSGSVVVDDRGDYSYAPTVDDALASVTGPLDYTFGAFKIQPRTDADIVVPLPAAFVINEINADPDAVLGDANGDGVVDTTQDEFVEIVNTLDDDQDISGWTLADGYTVRHTFPAGTLIPAHCAVVIFGGGNPSGTFGNTVVQTASSGLLGLNNDGDNLTLSNGSSAQAVASYGNEGGQNQSLTRDPDITGAFVLHTTATNSGGALYSPGTLVDGSPFAGCDAPDPFGACGDPATPIHEVQGSGATSPLVGATNVILEGVVVGDFQDISTGLRGFFLQEEDAQADADPATSEGIFVYDYGFMDVNVGDVVRVMGKIVEYYELTEMNGVSRMAVCASGVGVTPATITLPVPDLSVWEQSEGMLIQIPQTLVASDNYTWGRYGEVILSVESRLFQPTNVVLPGADAQALQDLNLRSQIQLDDGSNVQNPLPLPPYIGPDNTLRAGDTLAGLTGALSYSFGVYEVHPTGPLSFERVNARQAAPAAVDGPIRVASFNVLNFFNGDGLGGGFPTSRGAGTLDEFVRQRTKIISAISALDADIVGLMEIENDPTPYSAVEDLVNGLNEAAGATVYSFIDTGVVGSDEIRVALIYKPARVTPVGPFAILDSTVDPTFIDTLNRPALAQSFQHVTGEVLTVAVNHLKSKGSDCNDVGDPDLGDGQGNCNLTRLAAAEALVNWLASYPTGVNDPDMVIIGDLNSYAMEDPIRAIQAAGYTNLVAQFGGTWAYSYVFDGQAGYLDHGLATASLTARATGAIDWHINADEPTALDYNDYNQPDLYQPDAFRASDHDPVLIGFCDAAAPVVSVSLTPDHIWPPNHEYVTVSATVEAADPTGGVTVSLLSVTSNQPGNGKGDGHTDDDIVILDDYTFDLRAERSGVLGPRVYTIKYQAVDGCGNVSVATATVTVARH